MESPKSATYVIDFFEARHQLLTQSERIAQEREMHRQVRESVIRRERSRGSGDVFEDAFYGLISAAALAYLVLGIFGL